MCSKVFLKGFKQLGGEFEIVQKHTENWDLKNLKKQTKKTTINSSGEKKKKGIVIIVHLEDSTKNNVFLHNNIKTNINITDRFPNLWLFWKNGNENNESIWREGHVGNEKKLTFYFPKLLPKMEEGEDN